MIRLKCINETCGYSYEVSENEIKEYGQYHTKCLLCKSKMKVVNLEEIVEKDLYQRAEEYIKKWVAEIGWDNTLDLIKKNKNQGCYRIYKEILEKKGFTIKGE